MKWALAILMLAASCSLTAQITVQAGKQTQVPAPGSTSAVSLNLHVADASVENGVLTITGVDPGDTRVIAVNSNGLQEVRIHVSPAPPIYPPGFLPPRYSENDSGAYEFRFSSDRLQFENSLDLYSKTSDKIRQLHVVLATLAGGTGPTSYVPSAFYRVATQHMDVTLLDQTVNNSPLTLQNVVLRGFHMKADALQFHGGYSDSANFANVFLSTEKEFAAGVSYTTVLRDFLNVTPNLYFLRSIDLADGQQRSAVIGSLLFNLRLASDWELRSEVAYGRGAAFAGELEHSGPATKLRARIVKKRVEFPSVRSNALPGLSGDAFWSQVLTERLGLLSGATVSNVDLKTVQQNSQSAYTSLRYKMSQSWSVGSGISYGSFTSVGSYSVKSLTLPQQVNFDRAHFGAGFQYKFSAASNSFSEGAGFRQTVRLNLGRFQIGEFLDWQKDALSVASLYSQLPGLQQELQRLGITAVTPEQLAALLQDAAFLQSLGLSSQAQIVTVPHRLQEGGNLTWSSSGTRPHQLSLAFIASHNRFATSTSNDYNFTETYTKEISASNQLQLSGSIVQWGMVGHRELTPVVSVSLRHTFSHAPAIFSAQENTSIGGTVFVDVKRRGSFEVGMETVPRAIVILDGERTAVTDGLGHFRFGGVSTGDHRLQLQYDSGRAHYYTTPQDTVAAGGSNVNFGIAFPTMDLWGYVEDDAGNGMENLRLQIRATAGTIVISTDPSGKFVLPDVQSGSYQVQVSPESVPTGYSTEYLAPAHVSMTASSISHLLIKILAIRVLTGTVTVYDAAAGRYIPVKGAMVSIPKLSKSVTTGGSGTFTITGLTPGDLEVTVVAGRSTFNQTINVPIHPVTITDDFRVSSLDGQIVSTLAIASR